MQLSKLACERGCHLSVGGMQKGSHLSIEGIRKGYLLCQKWYIQQLFLETEWAIGSEAMRARGIIFSVKSN